MGFQMQVRMDDLERNGKTNIHNSFIYKWRTENKQTVFFEKNSNCAQMIEVLSPAPQYSLYWTHKTCDENALKSLLYNSIN